MIHVDHKAVSHDSVTTRCERSLVALESRPTRPATRHLVAASRDSIPEWFAEVLVVGESARQQGAHEALLNQGNLVRG